MGRPLVVLLTLRATCSSGYGSLRDRVHSPNLATAEVDVRHKRGDGARVLSSSLARRQWVRNAPGETTWRQVLEYSLQRDDGTASDAGLHLLYDNDAASGAR